MEPFKGNTYYTFVSGCPLDGQYSIANSASKVCYNWHVLPEDHTPNDQRGNMLFFNGGYHKGEFYKQSVTGLCPDNFNELSLWLLNLSQPYMPPPEITIEIKTLDGVLIKSFDTGKIISTTTPTWHQFSTTFFAPSNSITIRLLTNVAGGRGNDFALDDIKLKQCVADVKVPDVFTPNNDGVNDVLYIHHQRLSSPNFKVYDRWGSLVFITEDLNNNWDGQYKGSPAEDGVYLYKLEYEDCLFNKQTKVSRAGRILLVR
ncbi:hypothetical protein GCM10023189_32110 [Nibrella saemangeumensis]|uniref:Gliding motility-associated C-terminal domain-containing protein n=1 Tax=Nibrella saemangeumensis TaxID=1084526 RepID=A0ABP8N029_9BACT